MTAPLLSTTTPPRRFVPEARDADGRGARRGRERLVGPWRGARGAAADRGGPGEVARLVGGDAKLVTFTSGGTEANDTVLTPDWSFTRTSRTGPNSFSSARPSTSRSSPAGRFAAGAGPADSGRCGRRRSGSTPSGACSKSSPVERGAAAGLGDARQQRDRRRSSRSPRSPGSRMRPARSSIPTRSRPPGGFRSTSPPSASTSSRSRPTRSAARKGRGRSSARTRTSPSRRSSPVAARRSGCRAGTENVAAIAGFGAAAAAAARISPRREVWNGWRDALADTISPRSDRPVTVFGAGAERLPQTLCIGVAGIPPKRW